jgi:hypothetical protein
VERAEGRDEPGRPAPLPAGPARAHRSAPPPRRTPAKLQAKYDHPDHEYIGGHLDKEGRRKELAIPGPGVAFPKPGKERGDGRRFSVFFDLLQRLKSDHGKLRGINHVDVDANGKPTKRELDAAERARRAVKFIDIILEPKQHQLDRLRTRKGERERHPLDED